MTDKDEEKRLKDEMEKAAEQLKKQREAEGYGK